MVQEIFHHGIPFLVLLEQKVVEFVPSISTDYIKSDKYKLFTISIKNFIMFLKFIGFTKKLNYEIQKFKI